MLTLQNLKRIDHHHERVGGIDFSFLPGRSYALIGPNGAGKSTLLSMLSGQLKPSHGSIRLGDRELADWTHEERARLISWLPQQEKQDVPFSVEEFVQLGRWPHRAESRTDDPVERCGLADFRHRLIPTLSGGEFRLAGLARVLAQDTAVTLLDELDQGLDLANRQRALTLVQEELTRNDRTVIAVLHDIQAAAVYFDELLLLARGGRLLAAGPPREVLTKPNLDALFMADLFVEDSTLGDGPVIMTAAARTTEPRLTGKRIHLVCGGGSGGAMLALLTREGARLTAGVLNVGDSDWKAATMLGVDAVTVDPFTAIHPEASLRNRNRMAAAEHVIVCGFPVGSGNLLNLVDLVTLAREKPGQLILFGAENFSDHTGGQAEPRIRELQSLSVCVDLPEDVVSRCQAAAEST